MLFERKKIGLFISIFITLGILTNYYQNKTSLDNVEENGLLLIETFKKMNIEVENILINYSSQISSDEEAEYIHKFKTKVEQVFSVNLSLTSDQNQKDIIKYEGVSTSTSTKLRIVWVGVQDDNKSDKNSYKTFLVASFQKEYREKYIFMNQSLNALSIVPVFKINVQGNIDKKMNHYEQQQLTNTMFGQLEAIKTEGLIEEKVISLTGFSNLLSYSINSNGTPINIQIASRYDPIDNRTKFTIGTPVITMEY